MTTTPTLKKKIVVKCLFLGDTKAGKSEFIKTFTKQTPIKGSDFATKVVEIDGIAVQLQLWDTAGGERFRDITKAYLRGKDCIFVLYDISDQHSFEAACYWVKESLEHGKKCVLVANKCDIQAEHTEGENFAKGSNIEFFKVASRENLHISEAILETVDFFLKSQLEAKSEPTTIQPTNNSLPTDSKCW